MLPPQQGTRVAMSLLKSLKRLLKLALGLCGLALLMGLAFVVLDKCYPLPTPGRGSPYASLVVARDGTPLRAFPDRHHVWRYPIPLEQVAPEYIEALLNYEDRYFWWHPGVNPVALLRAAWQWKTHGRIVSGGSTISMQVARMVAPVPRTPAGKARQIFRAMQLELHHSKREILELYLNYAPMGGVLEGVESASRAYLGKPALRLTPAEAALLAVLPQAPSLLRPDRFPERARAARDKVILRMSKRWTAEVIEDALTEPVVVLRIQDPLLAPLYAERVKQMRPGTLRIDGTIEPAIQSNVEMLLSHLANTLPERVSLAAMVMDNTTLEVLAYVGSADFFNSRRFNHVDMVRAKRSPGSTLKPFLYAMALDEGLIHSESLLSDTPQSFDGYQPGNFQEKFSGPVSVSEALVRSLNVPAVEVFEHYGPERFVAHLRQGGLKLDLPRGAAANLSIILGGAAVTLENMVGAYSSLARGGIAGQPRLLPDEPVRERRMMSEGAAFVVRDILESGGPVGRAVGIRGNTRGIAYKTGTSFGFRDAWSVGVSDKYTVGVWVGRPDGTPNPGFFGANVAAPLLVSIFNALPADAKLSFRQPPDSVSQKTICWPQGTTAPTEEELSNVALCPIRRTAWVLNNIVPPTFAERRASKLSPILTYHVDRESKQRVMPDCSSKPYDTFEVARWPDSLLPWLTPALLQQNMPPPWTPRCAALYHTGGNIRITGASNGEWIQRTPSQTVPSVRLRVQGAQSRIHWIVNGRLVAKTGPLVSHVVRLEESGRYEITALDEKGRFDRINLSVRGH